MCRTLPDFNWHARVARSLSDSWASCSDWETRLSRKSAGIVENFSEFYISKTGGDFVAKFLRFVVYCCQTGGWIKMPLGTEVGIGQGHIVLDGDQLPLQKGAQQRCPPPLFGPWPCILWSSCRPSQQLLSSCFKLESAHKFWRGEGSNEFMQAGSTLFVQMI